MSSGRSSGFNERSSAVNRIVDSLHHSGTRICSISSMARARDCITLQLAVLWTTGVIILLAGLIITIIAFIREESENLKTASYFTLAGGIFLGMSALCRFYQGFAIPVGVPIILIIGWWMYKEADETDELDETDNNT